MVTQLAFAAVCALLVVHPASAQDPRVRELHEAAAGGDVAAVSRLLEQDGKLVGGRFGVFLSTPLHEAARANQVPVVELLLQCRADLDAQDRSGSTPLLAAIRAGARESALLLVMRGARLDLQDGTGETALHAAAEGGHTALVNLLLARGADPRAVNASGETALVIALRKQREETAERLRPVSPQPPPAVPKPEPAAPAKAEPAAAPAAPPARSEAEFVSDALRAVDEALLAKAPAFVTDKNAFLAAVRSPKEDYWTTWKGRMEYASKKFQSPAGKELVVNDFKATDAEIRAWADGVATDLVRMYLKSEMFAAATGGDLPALQRIAAADPSLVKAMDANGSTLFQVALRGKGNAAVPEWLMEQGADLWGRYDDGTLTVHWAAALDSPAILGRILARFKSPNERTAAGETPLHFAMMFLRVENVKLLLAQGGRLDAADKNGETPVEVLRQSEWMFEEEGAGTRAAAIWKLLAPYGYKRAPSLPEIR